MKTIQQLVPCLAVLMGTSFGAVSDSALDQTIAADAAGPNAWSAKKEGEHASPDEPTHVVSVTPRDGAKRVDVNGILQVHFSNGLTLVTINEESVRLFDLRDVPVPVQLGTDLEGDVVNFCVRKVVDGRSTPPRPHRSNIFLARSLH